MDKNKEIEEMAFIALKNTLSYTCAKQIAINFYNAGYRKVPDCAVILTPKERNEEIKACNEKQAKLKSEIERLKADNEALQMWNNNSADTIQKLSETNKRFASNMKSVLEIEKKKAVKEFAEKLKGKLQDFGDGGEKGAYITEKDIYEAVEKPVDTSKRKYESIDGIVRGFVVKDGKILYVTNILDGCRHEFKDIHEICDELNKDMEEIDRLMELNNHLRFQLDELKGDKND